MNNTYEEVAALTDFADIRTLKMKGQDCHCESNPAAIQHNGDGSIWLKNWILEGADHRVGAPALIYYHEEEVFPGDSRTLEELEADGVVSHRAWFINGKWKGNKYRKDLTLV